jgi:uncharacterized protein YlzI (FlbEa/FlbD family)
MFLRLPKKDGEYVLVNSDNITYIRPYIEQAIIQFIDGSNLVVRESIDEIEKLIQGE